ncbi:MFS transporter [Paenibacillus sp. 32352]|uniref:MFS transporter n=1 Tax=Paenibacillus sp. 32352 TaxID=1969111 RepID=UPI0009ADA7E9|nr:MFS transporter [Paenibacillus sp. 32352]
MSKELDSSRFTQSKLMLLAAISCGFIVANLYYSQTLVGPISLATGLSSSASGFIVTLTQIGYVLGLLFIVPLSDIIENRRLMAGSLSIVVLALLAAAGASSSAVFLTASLIIGLGSVVAQILVPFVTYLTPAEHRGRVIGNVMSGLLLGIMLARPAASLIAGLWGWRTVFAASAVVTALLTVLLARRLPQRKPVPSVSYGKLLASLGRLFKDTPALRRRAFYQASLFGAFSLFWTVVPLRLADAFGMTQQGIALFALVGVGGAVAAPIAGRLADRGWSRIATGMAISIAIVSLLLIDVFQDHSTLALVLLYVSAITLDMAVSGNLVLGQRVIYSLGSEVRGRLNGLFMAIFFIGGAVGSSLGGWSYANGGWSMALALGIVLPLAALLYFFTEMRQGFSTSKEQR